MSPQYGELRPTSGWDRLTSLGYPCKIQLVSRLGSVTAQHLVVAVSQTLRRSTEGVTYIRQGGHHVGHWPTFLALFNFKRGSLCTLELIDWVSYWVQVLRPTWHMIGPFGDVGLWAWMRCGSRSPPCQGAFLRIRPCPTTLCRELCKNGWTDRDAVGLWTGVCGTKESCIRWGCTLAPPGEYHWRQCAAAMRPVVKLLWPLILCYCWPAVTNAQCAVAAVRATQDNNARRRAVSHVAAPGTFRWRLLPPAGHSINAPGYVL